ncbi:MAG: NPXTG-anchored protein [Oscillospiraceae bacterium]
MKLRNLVSAIAAAAVALSTAISVSAEKVAVDVNDAKYLGASGDKGKYVTLFQSDKVEVPFGYCIDTDLELSDVYGFKVYVKFDQTELDNGTWVAGGIAVNSESTGWKCTEWAAQEGAKPISADLKENSVTYFDEESKAPLFKDTDTYCQLHFQTWGGTVEIVKFELLNKRGKVIVGYAEAPAETEPAVTEPAETEPVEEPVVEEPTEEAPVVEPTEEAPVEEPTEEAPVVEEPTEEAPAEESAEAPAEGGEAETNTPADNKGNPDTGVEGIAVVAGLAAVAGVAFAVSRKRK